MAQYVDDLTIFVSDEDSANEVFDILELFYKASGLKVNKNKTEATWLGINRNLNVKPVNVNWPESPIKILGIYLSYDDV